MKRRLWLLMLFLFAGHVPAASADSACEGRFVNPITDICWSCIFPLSLGSIKVSQGKVPDTANPSMPIQICPAPPPLFRRIGLAIGYWEPMALTDVTRSPGCMVNLGFSLPAFGKTAQGTAKKDEKQVNGAFYHVHWYKYRACNGGQLRDDLHATGQCHLQQNGDAVWRRTGIKKHRLFVPQSGNRQSFPGLCAELCYGGYLPEPQIHAGGADGLR